ncbi:hypothetical protein [Glaciibacter psychrotolerans]|uniref:Ethanolamine utilization microcompartment shell protein EutS n=1 Tax=Glaciibacter psychrotolerans TaxID=670054 RepID=A0A7Z0ED23_9MICO|nr:hypothetical protein [Leifsonia psychrotolerans]NYJ19243.1 ethanolamine utilization microcompartment shell protein EutS [Leifsonia psychrotolerans]
MTHTKSLPPVEDWWPHLDIPAKQWFVAHLEGAIPANILAEITTICDMASAPSSGDVFLTPAERSFIATQIEFVD